MSAAPTPALRCGLCAALLEEEYEGMHAGWHQAQADALRRLDAAIERIGNRMRPIG